MRGEKPAIRSPIPEPTSRPARNRPGQRAESAAHQRLEGEMPRRSPVVVRNCQNAPLDSRRRMARRTATRRARQALSPRGDDPPRCDFPQRAGKMRSREADPRHAAVDRPRAFSTMQDTLPITEAERLAVLRRYEILDTPPEDTFDRISALSARLFGTPIAGVSLVDHDRVWFKSTYGVDLTEIARDPGLCSTAILQTEGVYLVSSAKTDPRTSAHPFVTGEFGLQFYASAVLRTPDGYALGTLFILDTKPRHLDARELQSFEDLGNLVMAQIEHRAANQQLVAAETQARRLEARMRKAQKMESLGLLAGGIAHDFNNLLTAILGNTDLARAHLTEDSPAQGSLERVDAAARRAAALCREMLAFAGRGRIDLCNVDLNEVVNDLRRILDASLPKKAELVLDLDTGCSLLRADASQMGQVVMNLLLNAAEALEDAPGRITVRTRDRVCTAEELAASYLGDELPAGRYVELAVTDTGCGMTEDTLERLFDPFFSTKFAGRGLGLAAVLGVVRRHKGAISVRSESGRGTEFRVLYPAIERARRPRTEPKRASEAAPSCPVRSKLVLLVDDEEIVRDVGTQMLERAGVAVVTAADGIEAIERLREFGDEVACVLLDLTMPRMDGVEAFHELRALRPDLPIVLSTGHAEEQLMAKLQDASVDGFIGKPYVYSDLMQRISHVLGAN
ncbi:MAG: response regulator [Myxococcales bacterium FL481]|nr:MAG: response regulator [Myxococcales bacterium FL481]